MTGLVSRSEELGRGVALVSPCGAEVLVAAEALPPWGVDHDSTPPWPEIKLRSGRGEEAASAPFVDVGPPFAPEHRMQGLGHNEHFTYVRRNFTVTRILTTHPHPTLPNTSAILTKANGPVGFPQEPAR